MKGILFASSIITLAVCGCGKKSQPQAGSQYTKQIAGNRNYAHEGYQSFADPSKKPVTTTDTVALTITYVNDATIKVKSYTLTYYPGSSNDSTSVFVQKMDGDPPSMSVK